MARRTSSDDDPGVLIPIAEVAWKVGCAEAQVWNVLKESDVYREWEGTYCVQRPVAKRLRGELGAAQEEYERRERERRERQMADELEGRMRPIREYEKAQAAAKAKVRGVEVSVPDAEQPWADQPSREDES